MSSPRWDRVEVDNLETISQTKQNRGGKNSQQHTHRLGEKQKEVPHAGQQQQQQLKRKNKKMLAELIFPGLEKQHENNKMVRDAMPCVLTARRSLSV
jgi:hypothetical protein